MYDDPFHLVVVFGHCSSLTDVFPQFMCVLITLETAAVDTPNKVAGLVTDAAAKRAQTICPLWKSDKSPIVQYFRTNCH